MDKRFRIEVGISINTVQALKEVKMAINKIEKQLKGLNVDIDTKKARKELDKLDTKMKKLNKTTKTKTKTQAKSNKTTKDGAKQTKILGQSAVEAAGKFATWAAIGAVVYGVSDAVKSLFRITVDVEEAFANFQIVSDATDGQLESVNSTIDRLSSNLGALKTEVIDASTEFARAGFEMSESMELAEQAIIGANVGFTDLQSVSTILISSLKAFNLEAEDSKNVINDLFVTSKESAVTFQGLGEAVRRSGNSLREAGVSYEQSLGLIAAANESVQDPAKVGSALKTIQARLRGIDKSSNLPKLAGLLNEVGVDIENANGGFRNMYDILDDLSASINNSNDEFKRQLILEELAGKRRANILAGLINNFNTATDIVQKTSDSIDSATESQEKLLETSAGQIKKMTSNWQVFSQNVIDSDLVKATLTGINNTLEKMNNNMQVESKFELNIDESKLAGQMNDFTKVFGRVAGNFEKENQEFWESIKEMNEEELSTFGEELTPIANDYNILIAEIEQTTEKLEQARNKAKQEDAGSDEERQQIELIKTYNKQLSNQKQRYTELTQELGEYSLIGLEVNEVLDYIADNTYRLEQGQDGVNDSIDYTTQTLTAYEKALHGVVDITDSATSDMLSDFQYYSDEKQKAIISGMNTQLESLQKEIKGIELKINALDDLNNKIRESNALNGENVKLEKRYMRNNRDYTSQMESLITESNKLKSSMDGLLKSESDSAGKGSVTEPLSKLEVALRDIRHENELLESELKQTETYKERVRVTGELIDKLDEEKDILEQLETSKLKEVKAEKDNTVAKQEAMEEYQKLVMDINKADMAIYKYEQSLSSLEQTMRDNEFESISDTFETIANNIRDKVNAEIENLEGNIENVSSAIEQINDLEVSNMTDAERLSEAKDNIGSIVDDLKNADSDKYEDIINKFSDYMNLIDSSYDDAIGKVKSATDEAINKSKELVDSLKNELSSLDSFLEDLELNEKFSNILDGDGSISQFISDEIMAIDDSIVGEMSSEELIEYSKNIKDTYNSIDGYYNEYISNIEDSYNEEEQATEDNFASFEDTLEKKTEAIKENIQARIDAIDDEISALRERREEEDYVDERQDVLDKIAELENKREMLLVDNSLKAKNDKKEIEAELLEYREELSEIDRDRKYELEEDKLETEKDSLNEQLRNVETSFDERIAEERQFTDKKKEEVNERAEHEINALRLELEENKALLQEKLVTVQENIDMQIDAENTRQENMMSNMDAEIESINNTREEYQSLYSTIINQSNQLLGQKKDNYNQDISNLESYLDTFNEKVDEFEDDWGTFGNTIGSAFENGIMPSIETVLDALEEITGKEVDVGLDSGSSIGDSGSGSTTTDIVLPDGTRTTGVITDGRTTLEDGGEIPNGTLVNTAGGVYQKQADGSVRREDLEDDGYFRHSGGVVGGESFENMGFLNYLDNMAPNEVPIIAEAGEVVLTPNQMRSLSQGSDGNNFQSALNIESLEINATSDVDVRETGRMLGAEVRKALAKRGRV